MRVTLQTRRTVSQPHSEWICPKFQHLWLRAELLRARLPRRVAGLRRLLAEAKTHFRFPVVGHVTERLTFVQWLMLCSAMHQLLLG